AAGEIPRPLGRLGRAAVHGIRVLRPFRGSSRFAGSLPGVDPAIHLSPKAGPVRLSLVDRFPYRPHRNRRNATADLILRMQGEGSPSRLRGGVPRKARCLSKDGRWYDLAWSPPFETRATARSSARGRGGISV